VDKLDYRAPTMLPDGGRVTVIDNELVPLVDTFGDGAHACRKMGYSREGIAAVLEIQSGTPVCVELRLTKDAGLTAADLRGVPLARLVRDVYGYAGTWVGDGDGGWMRLIGPAATARDRERVADATRRRVVNGEFLAQVRELHAAATGTAGQRVAAVAAALHVSTRQAARYIAKAGV
jgi:hypothetical protein